MKNKLNFDKGLTRSLLKLSNKVKANGFDANTILIEIVKWNKQGYRVKF